MNIRKAAPDDWRELRRLAKSLLGSADEIDAWDEQIFVCDNGGGRLCGFISVSARPWTEGTRVQPVAHVEAWFVDRKKRRQGVGTKLMRAAEHWASLNGFSEIASDAELDNEVSLAAHEKAGFEPTLRLQYFRKTLCQAARRVAGQG
jgi:aminoglycoside 6'-N-acetyltransferase I